jgi:hemerythrin
MFKWDVKYSVDISIIDEEHRKYIDIINKAIVAREQSDNLEKIKEVSASISPLLNLCTAPHLSSSDFCST